MGLKRDYIKIHTEQPNTKTESGFQLKEISKTYQSVGKVVGIGPLVEDVKVGDRVAFLRFAALDHVEKDHKYCQEKHIIESF